MKIGWMKHPWLYFLISALFILPGIYSLIRWGLKPSIDFTGGTLLEINGEGLDEKLIETVLTSQNLVVQSYQTSGENSFLLRFGSLEQDLKEKFIKSLEEKTGKSITVVRWESLGPALGKELLTKTAMSIILAVLVILIYISLQFKEKSFGIFAILAMLHDTLVILGAFSILGHFLSVEVDSLFVTAVLTILSFSVHDTVVVYDRIRELGRLNPRFSFEELTSISISQTLTRSINNSLTIIFMLIALVWFGGGTVRWFATALLIGTISGTYSSTFTAVPLLVVWKKITGKKN